MEQRPYLEQVLEALSKRLDGEITERSQRQLEITGRLAALERDMQACIETLRQPHECKADDPDRMVMGLARAPGMATPFEDTRIAELERDLANARADAQVHQSARQAGEQWEAEVRTALGVGPGESRKWMVAEVARRTRDVATYRQRWEAQAATIGHQGARNRDLEAQVAALQKAIDDVWALIEKPDGYGSPCWSEPGLDDTTPAQAIERVMKHLREKIERTAAAGISAWRPPIMIVNPANAEAMAALNAADRQSDDDQICGC